MVKESKHYLYDLYTLFLRLSYYGFFFPAYFLLSGGTFCSALLQVLLQYLKRDTWDAPEYSDTSSSVATIVPESSINDPSYRTLEQLMGLQTLFLSGQSAQTQFSSTVYPVLKMGPIRSMGQFRLNFLWQIRPLLLGKITFLRSKSSINQKVSD